jgi:hypothetical protein
MCARQGMERTELIEKDQEGIVRDLMDVYPGILVK